MTAPQQTNGEARAEEFRQWQAGHIERQTRAAEATAAATGTVRTIVVLLFVLLLIATVVAIGLTLGGGVNSVG